MRRAFLSAAQRVAAGLAGALLLATTGWVNAQPAAKAPTGTATSSTVSVSRPAWRDLTPSQREALAPLETKWDSFDADRKQKWLEVATKYPNLSPDGKQRLHERMAEFAKLTPQQRQTLRENFKRAYELPADQRQALLQEYKDLPPDQRQALIDKAAKKDEPPRRPTRDLSDRAARSAPAPAK